ncbi:C4-dicarboxylate transporter DcuC [Entomospira nematocerorum]|uniref:C4-dicarboxylate transporter DcuC n=1 Tax=Entomospira nematocerorum TaxID=2719987 RepID=A0A968GBW4_9SPIO|nr:C4-dicarboxylate transporter DcuC [Entomospira nematocera]NIZ46583.1 C4-dicarboxylate transporter DcuC [Entomospira nematocera]WDI33619.1 C4-dicarboxylate transporter DcuC [Entomospira nematocera]
MIIVSILLLILSFILLFIGLRRRLPTSVWLIIIASLSIYLQFLTGISQESPLKIITQSIHNSFTNTAYIIMILFGYNTYMQHIGANDALIKIFTPKLRRIRHPYLLLMVSFIIASLLSTVITSAAALAILLLATLYPLLKEARLSSIAIGSIIVSSPGIMPSPLAIETSMSAQALQMSLVKYISLSYTITLPMLCIMALTHGLWHYFCDKKEGLLPARRLHHVQVEQLQISHLDTVKAILPLLPIIFFIFFSLIPSNIDINIITMIFLATTVSILIDILLHKSIRSSLEKALYLWQGAAQGLIQVGSIVISAGLFTTMIKNSQIITYLSEILQISTLGSIGIVFVLVLSILTVGITTGSGLALYFGLAPLVPIFANIAHIEGWKLSTLLEVTAHSSRTFSHLAAVMIVTSQHLQITMPSLIKRTWLPVVLGLASLLIQLYLPL